MDRTRTCVSCFLHFAQRCSTCIGESSLAWDLQASSWVVILRSKFFEVRPTDGLMKSGERRKCLPSVWVCMSMYVPDALRKDNPRWWAHILSAHSTKPVKDLKRTFESYAGTTLRLR